MDLFRWIEQELCPRKCDSTELIYNDMDSQSGRCLPIIYQPFDTGKRGHWADRGSLFDFLYSVGNGRILDFGPGDGWPSLILAPEVDEVIGVDASARRVEVCRESADRLGVENARFVHVPSGNRLPFGDAEFDGVTAASSLEQTPAPFDALAELCRVLKPGGCLRLVYEGLERYRGGRENELGIWPVHESCCILLLYDRHIDSEFTDQYALVMQTGKSQLLEMLQVPASDFTIDHLSEAALEVLRPLVAEARVCRLTHPSGRTWSEKMREIGFGEVLATLSGAQIAVDVFAQLTESERPSDMAGVDEILRSNVRDAISNPVELHHDPPLTATK
jgi:ubiquinone/menaquinone biosynthesis C-methylase UbiE